MDNVFYSYRLIGFNANWSKPGNETKAVYTNLNPGHYTFELVSSNGKNNFGEVISYQIYIRPPFYLTWWFKTLVICIIIIAIYVVVQLRLKNIKRQNIALEHKVNERTTQLNLKSVELENSNALLLHKDKLITESLDYAKKIQESILPSQDYLDNKFKGIVKTAALYLPKDIVSGDFYYSYRKNDFNYFALADCTGHGVPGAMLSFSVNSILHGIIDNLSSYQEPATILKKLVEGFSEIYIKDQDVKESIDISLVCYLNDHKKIFFSGISQSIALLTNNELTEVKSQKSFLIHNNEDLPHFKFSVNKGDRVYFYSDGYYDQKNSATKRRMYKSGLYNKIHETKHLSLLTQIQTLNDYFLKFKVGHEQIDDVTIFAIEIE